VQEEILEPNPKAKIVVYAVWFNMFPTDHRSRWDDSLITDDRVIHFWDQPRESGRWFAQQGFYPFGDTAWDIYFLYGPEAVWETTPEPLLSSGYTIIVQRDRLIEDITPLLQPE
jgi:hypothetical protein